MNIELEFQCACCHGRGRVPRLGDCDAEEDGCLECRECNGSGYRPTELGKQILLLVQHNSKVKIRTEFQCGPNLLMRDF